VTVEDIFHAAVEKGSAQRAAYLDAACGNDSALRAQVEALLRAHEEAGSLLEQPLFRAAPTEDLRSADSAGTTVGPYKLLQQIGEGGMGTVFMAEQLEPVKRKVAVKIIKAGMDSRQVIARFEAERQALAMMDHVNIARVFDGGATENGRPYFVMELVHGVPITKYCDDNHLTPRERLELFVPVCQAIQHAHQKGIIHRDIKPSNVMITLYDGKPVPKVIDFGVAKATEQKLTERTLFTQYGTMVGTLEYMSPEQAEMSALGVDTRSDIYSLGVLLYELLTGTTPLSHKRLKEAAYGEVVRMIREEEPPRPSTRLSESGAALASISAQRHMEPTKLMKLMRGELDWIVMKTLEKDRNRRYETANAFAADVQRYLADETVQACPPSALYRLRKFVRRNRGPVVAVALVMAVLVAGIAGTSVGLVRSEQSRAEAIDARNSEADQRKAAEASDKEAREAGGKLREVRDELRVSLYAARSNLIQSAWEAHGVTRMRELLAGQKPGPGEPDLRGFEWHYWDRRVHAELTTGPSASDFERARVSRRLISPNGRRQAVLWGGVTRIEVRDTATGSTLSNFNLSPPAGEPHVPFEYPALAFTSDSDALFASVTLPGAKGKASRIHWWLFDAATGKELAPHQEAPCADDSPPWGLGPDRTLFGVPDRVGGAKAVRLKIREVATGKEARVCEGTFVAIHQTAFRPDGKELAALVSTTVQERIVVKLWDTATGRERLSLPAGTDPLIGMVWSPDGRRLAAGPRIWNTEDGREVLAPPGPDGWIGCSAFSPDGGRLACLEPGSRVVTLRDTATGNLRATFKVPDEFIAGLAFTVDGTRLVTISRFGSVRTWDATANDQAVDLIPPAGSFRVTPWPHWRHAIGADGTRIVAVGEGENESVACLQAWDHTGRPLLTTTRACPRDKQMMTRPVYAVAITADGRRAAWSYGLSVGDAPVPDGVPVGRLAVIDLATGKDLWVRETQQFTWSYFSPDGRMLAFHVPAAPAGNVHAPGVVKVLDTESGSELHSFPADCSHLHFSRDGTRLVGLGFPSGPATGRSYPIPVWDLRTGSAVPSGSYPAELVESPGMANTAVNSDCTRLAVSWRAYDVADGRVRMFDIPSGRELRSLSGLDTAISWLAFSPDGTRLAASGSTTKIWDTATGLDLITLRDSPAEVVDLQFSRDGHKLHAVGRSGGNYGLKTWDASPRR